MCLLFFPLGDAYIVYSKLKRTSLVVYNITTKCGVNSGMSKRLLRSRHSRMLLVSDSFVYVDHLIYSYPKRTADGISMFRNYRFMDTLSCWPFTLTITTSSQPTSRI